MRALSAFTLTFSALCLWEGASRAQPPQRPEPKPPLSISSVTVPLINMPYTMGLAPSLGLTTRPVPSATVQGGGTPSGGGTPPVSLPVSPSRAGRMVVPARSPQFATTGRATTELNQVTGSIVLPERSVHSAGLIGFAARAGHAGASLVIPDQAGKIASLIDISDPNSSLADATAPMILAQLRSGLLDIDAAWKKGLVSPEAAVGLLSSPLLVYDVTDEAIRIRLADLVMERTPELLVTASKDNDEAKLALADWHAARSKVAAGALYEELLSADLSTEVVENTAPFRIIALERAVKYYQAMGEYGKAGDALAGAGRFTNLPSYLSNSLVEAARFYRQAGDEGKAQEQYAQVAEKGYGWATGIMLCDQSTELIAKGQYEDAIKLLRTSIKGQYVEQVNIGILSLLGYCYYKKEDWEKAKECSLQSIDQVEKVGRVLPGENLESAVNKAREVLRWSQMWIEKPLHCSTEKVALNVGSGAMTPAMSKSKRKNGLSFNFTICSYRYMNLEVSCSDPEITWKVTPPRDKTSKVREGQSPNFVEWQVEVGVPSLAERKATLRIGSADVTGAQCEIPFSVKSS